MQHAPSRECQAAPAVLGWRCPAGPACPRFQPLYTHNPLTPVALGELCRDPSLPSRAQVCTVCKLPTDRASQSLSSLLDGQPPNCDANTSRLVPRNAPRTFLAAPNQPNRAALERPGMRQVPVTREPSRKTRHTRVVGTLKNWSYKAACRTCAVWASTCGGAPNYATCTTAPQGRAIVRAAYVCDAASEARKGHAHLAAYARQYH